MKCEDCKNISNCKDKADNPSFYGCTSGVPDNPIIKPCPFCGGKAVIYGKGNSKSVYCKNDNCRLGLAPKIQGIEDKIKEWNKKA